jgi:hypothetical protein
MIEPAEHLQVLAAAEDLVDGGLLADETDAGADLRGLALHVAAGDLGAAGIG